MTRPFTRYIGWISNQILLGLQGDHFPSNSLRKSLNEFLKIYTHFSISKEPNSLFPNLQELVERLSAPMHWIQIVGLKKTEAPPTFAACLDIRANRTLNAYKELENGQMWKPLNCDGSVAFLRRVSENNLKSLRQELGALNEHEVTLSEAFKTHMCIFKEVENKEEIQRFGAFLSVKEASRLSVSIPKTRNSPRNKAITGMEDFTFLRTALYVKEKTRDSKHTLSFPVKDSILESSIPSSSGEVKRLAILMMVDPLTGYGRRETISITGQPLLRYSQDGNLRYASGSCVSPPCPNSLVFVGADFLEGAAKYYIRELRRMGGCSLSSETDVLGILPDLENKNWIGLQQKFDLITAPQVVFPVSLPLSIGEMQHPIER